jgi:hypothetical protein
MIDHNELKRAIKQTMGWTEQQYSLYYSEAKKRSDIIFKLPNEKEIHPFLTFMD